MNAKKPKDDEVQKVRIEEVGPEVKEAHEKAVNASGYWKEVILGFFGVVIACTTCVQMYLQFRNNELQQMAATKVAEVAIQAKEIASQAEEIAVKAETVKQTLATTTNVTNGKLDGLKKTTDETKHLVNSDSLVTLKLLAEVSRWKATQTKDPDHLKAAELAEQNVLDHEKKQAELDAETKQSKKEAREDAKEKSTPP